MIIFNQVYIEAQDRDLVGNFNPRNWLEFSNTFSGEPHHGVVIAFTLLILSNLFLLQLTEFRHCGFIPYLRHFQR